MKSQISTLFKKSALAVVFALGSVGAFGQTFTTNDSVCLNSLDHVYGVTGHIASSHYSWSLTGGGTIDSSYTANNGEIMVDWTSATAGQTYTLSVIETTDNGCVGVSITLDIYIDILPTVTMDPIAPLCAADAPSDMVLNLTGEAPWSVTYDDGSGPVTVNNIMTSPHTITLPSYAAGSTTTVSITALSDNNGCDLDPATLPISEDAVIYLDPAAGPIYHY